MPKFAANLTMLFNEVPFLERFERAAAAGFRAVEFLFIHTVDAGAVERELERTGLELVLFDPEGGDFAAGDRGYLCDPSKRDHLHTTIQEAVATAKRVGCRRLVVGRGFADIDAALEEGTVLDADSLRHDIAGQRTFVANVNAVGCSNVAAHLPQDDGLTGGDVGGDDAIAAHRHPVARQVNRAFHAAIDV